MSGTLWLRVATVAALMLCLTNRASGQVARNLDYQLCTGCQVALELVTTLKGGSVGTPVAVHRLPDGRILAVFDENASSIYVFDADGNEVGIMGRRGQGPGEFGFIQFISPSDSVVVVVDTDLHRRSTFALRTLAHLSTTVIPTPISFLRELAVFSDGSLVVNGDVRTEDGIGYALHVLDPGGRYVRSLGTGDRIVGPAAPNRLLTLSRSRFGGVWLADITEYRIERWDLEGELRAAWQSRPRWFPDKNTGRSISVDIGPSPSLSGIAEDSAGRLWIVATVADARWRDGVVPGPIQHGRQTVRVRSQQEWLDTIIEVVDPDRGAVVATKQFDVALFAMVDRTHAASFDESADGEPVIRIWRMRLITQ